MNMLEFQRADPRLACARCRVLGGFQNLTHEIRIQIERVESFHDPGLDRTLCVETQCQFKFTEDLPIGTRS